MTRIRRPIQPDPDFPPPPKGSSIQFEEIFARTWEVVVASGNPENVTEDEARNMLAKRFGREAGRTFNETGELTK